MLEKGFRYLLNKKPTRVVIPPKVVPEEHFIVEISDSGDFFKSRSINGELKWFSTDKFDILEKLVKEN